MAELGHVVADPFGSILAKSSHPSASLARHSELIPILAPGNDAALVTVRRRGTVLVPLGPMGDPDKAAQILRELMVDPATKTVILTQTRQTQLPALRALGYKSEIFGRNYSINLPKFTDKGKPLAKVRQNVHRATREGVVVHEVDRGHELSSIVRAVSNEWIRQKGFHTKKLKLLVGEDIPVEAKTTRTFVAYLHAYGMAQMSRRCTSRTDESDWIAASNGSNR